MKVAIIGAAGFLGTKLVEYFSKEHEVFSFGINPSDEILKMDATDKAEVKRFLDKIKPDLVIDTVALTSSVRCEKDPKLCKQLNCDTALNILEACNELNVRMVFISSSYVFDGEKGNYSEEDEVKATNEYAKWKIAAEEELVKQDNCLIVRVDVMYGLFNGKIRFGSGNFDREVIEVGYPDQVRSPVFVEDVPKVIHKLVQLNQKGIFHIAGPDTLKMIDFLKSLGQIENAEDKIKIVDSTGWLVKSPNNSSLNISKIKSLGIQTTSFEDALELIKSQISF